MLCAFLSCGLRFRRLFISGYGFVIRKISVSGYGFAIRRFSLTDT